MRPEESLESTPSYLILPIAFDIAFDLIDDIKKLSQKQSPIPSP